MIRNQYIFILVLFLTQIFVDIGLAKLCSDQKQKEDPIFGLLSAIQIMEGENDALIKSYLSNPDWKNDWDVLESDIAATHSFVQIYNDNENFRTKHFDGESVCDSFSTKGYEVISCVQLFNRHNDINPHIKNIVHWQNDYIWNDSSPDFVLNRDGKNYGITKAKLRKDFDLSETRLWFNIPFLFALLILLIVPFRQKIFNKNFWIFPGLTIALLIHALIKTQFLEHASMELRMSQTVSNTSISMVLFFANLYFWSNQHRVNWKSKILQFGIHWIGILTLFGLGIFLISQREVYSTLLAPFSGIERIRYSDLSVISISVLLLFGHLISLHQHWMSLRMYNKGKAFRYGLLSTLCLAHIGIAYLTIPHCPIIPTALFLSIYFILVDLFSDGKQNSSIWAILWTVVISIMISALLFYNGFHKSINNTALLLESNIPSEIKFQLGSSYSEEMSSTLNAKDAKIACSENTSYNYHQGKVYFQTQNDNGITKSFVAEIPGFIKATSLFSLVFVTSIALYFMFMMLQLRFQLFPKTLSTNFLKFQSLSRKIQISFLLFTVISFSVIAFTTILLLNNQYRQNKETLLKSKLSGLKHQIYQAVNNYETKDTKLTSQLNQISEKNKVYTILYSKEGVSTNGTEQYISTNMQKYLDKYPTNSLSEELDNGGFISYMNTESSIYPYVKVAGVLDNKGPSMSIYDFVAGILNVYVFLFIIAVTLALFIAKSVVDPLAKLSDKMKRLRLGKENQTINWTGKDEIGLLISNYNEMVQQLEDSAAIIAQTERDMAWREMARQVAHEIKNPLTPMKLSIQHLQRQYESGIIPDKDKVNRISTTLLEQINNLDNIAKAFSNVAALPTASNEKIVLNDVVESVHDLFRKRDDMDIHLSEPINDLFIFADKNHLVRILNNILKNAIESIPESRRGMIKIRLYKENSNAVVQISDNGSGIPMAMREKVFTPKFTTKSSGSGLGLAIAANMIESFNGNISFETKDNNGTDFYISIPLMRLEENLNGNRVLLD